MLRRLKIERSAELEPEQLFIERYDRMLAWSLQLTNHDRDVAEDLLHDLFIQFVLNGPDPNVIENLDGYLYITLRNLHIAQQRRASRNRLVQLSIVEYDSAEIGLSTIDFRDQLAAQDDLRRMCLYACTRKENAKIASVLILRFFHGYYPEEITQVAGSPRAAIDKWLKLARGEAKASLGKDNKLAFFDQTELPDVARGEYAHPPADLLDELQETIFRSRQGECLDRKSLRALYPAAGQHIPLECGQLAHIVSCPVCLDGVNRLLGLDLLSERRATDTLTRDPGKRDDGDKGGGSDSGGGSTGGGMTNSVLGKLRRKVKDTFVHKPQELCVAVNGYALGSHRISATRSELNLVVERGEQIDFVEVYTEQKIRLLLHNIEELPPHGPGERTAIVRLSDERMLELSLRFTSPSPTIQVVYLDPMFNVTDSAADEEAIEIGSADTRHTKPPGETARPSDSAFLTLGLDGTESGVKPDTASPSGFVNNLKRFAKEISNAGFWLRPGTIAVLVTSFLLATVIYLNWSPTSNTIATAPEILRQATVAEQALAARSDLVLHRTINLEELNAASGKVRRRQRIDIWQSGERGASARRLFDEQGRLVAGEFTANGTSTVYTKRQHVRTGSSSDRVLTTVQSPQATVQNPDAVWQLAPSAKDFGALVGQANTTQLADTSDRYLISYDRDDPSATGLIKANLILNKADLRPVEQTLVVRQAAHGPNAGDELVEYRFVESSFEQRAPNTVAPSVFEPDPELLVPDAAVVVQKIKTDEPEPIDANTNTAARTSSAIATADLEVEVIRLLNQAGADIDDQTNVTRTSDGKLQVTGLVDSKERKNEVLRALETVANNPALIIKVETYAEAAARQKQTTTAPTTVERIEVNKGRIAVYDEVSRYLGKSGDDADEAVRRFSAQILNRSRLVMSEAGTLKKLAGRFSDDDLKSMSTEARAKWLAVIRVHANTCSSETKKLRQELQAVFPAGAGASSDGGRIAVDSDAELEQAAARLFSEAAANDRVIRSAFTISSDGSQNSGIRSQQFFRGLLNAERLAASLQAIR
jgi:DNA-directed RNA polymerase specialized sigma24 family protein